MPERRQYKRVRVRVRCELQVTPFDWRFNGFTRNLSVGGAEFEAMESLVRPGMAVKPGMLALITFPWLREGVTEECRFRCRICHVSANSAGLEFTDASRTPEQNAVLEQILTR